MRRAAATGPRHLAFAVLLVLIEIGGCATEPVQVASVGEPALVVIHEAFERAVDSADGDTALHWHSGHIGNAWVNFWGANNRGLCHHWQAYIYGEVLPTVERVRWAACGIAINCETENEHHAVLVYDPARVERDALLAAPPDAPSYVLDAWRYGRADVWRLEDWIAIPSRIRTPPELEELP